METAAALPASTKPRFGDGARSRRQLDTSQEAAIAAVAAVCSCLDSDDDMPSFFGRLSATIADLTGATRAAFWRLGPRGALAVQLAPHGFDHDSPVHTARWQLGATGKGAVEQLVFAGQLDLMKGTSAGLDETWHAAGLADVKNSIAAAWTAGDRRIGAVAAYDSPRGFTGHELWILRLAGMVAGLMWQYKEAEDELGHTAARLEEAMAARRHLLNDIAAGGDRARRRFASALIDDPLQLLTGAQLQLERIRSNPATINQPQQLDRLTQTLRKVEDSLGRLLTNVSSSIVSGR